MSEMNTTRWHLVEEIFCNALKKTGTERNQYLAQSCANEEGLRDEVEALLAAAQKSDGFMEPPRTGPLTPQPATSPVSHMEGRRIGSFEVIRTIASGGMGTVFEARQDKTRRSVAIKLMNAGLAAGHFHRRFSEEVAILGRLRHPNIASIFEASTFLDGEQSLPYFAMEYIEGGLPVTKYADEKQLDVSARLKLFVQLCQAVHYGHQNGVIHRDLKPANMLVDQSGWPKIIDFGVARVLDPTLSQTTMHTSVGQLVGTLAYTSPEQLAGDPNQVDVRADIYSLGLVLYELLCNQQPYDVADRPITEAIDILREPRAMKPSTVKRELRGDLETIILKAMAKEPERRYQSVTELVDDVQRFLAHEPIRARPPSLPYHFRMFAKRNQGLVIASALTLLALVLGMVVSATFWAREASARAKAEQMKTYLEQLLSSSNPQIAQGRELTVGELLNRTAPKLARELADQPEVEAEMHMIVAESYRALGHLEAAELHLRRVVLLKSMRGEWSREHTAAQAQLAALLAERHRIEEAKSLITKIQEHQSLLDKKGFEALARVETALAAAEARLSEEDIGSPAGDVVAYWRFDEGVVGAALPDTDSMTIWRAAALDFSGNGNHLASLDHPWAGHEWVGQTPASTVPQTGAGNFLAVQGYVGYTGLFTWSNKSRPTGVDIQTIMPREFTIEASFMQYMSRNNHQTIVGRDGIDVINPRASDSDDFDPGLSPLYLQIDPDRRLQFAFTDSEGRFHRVIHPHPQSEEAETIDVNRWYNVAAVSDGETASLYLDHLDGRGYRLVSQKQLPSGRTNLMQGSPHNAWSVGRGMHYGQRIDHFMGLIDEVRISIRALAPSEFLFAQPSETLPPSH